MTDYPQSLTLQFDSEKYISSLMEAIGFNDPDDPLHKEMAEELQKQMNYVVLSNVSLYADDEALDEIIIRFGKDNDLSKLVRELVRISPELQTYLLEGLKTLYDETVESYGRLKT